ncbi:unnamed protein product, partial [Rotaria sp. Silwood1]
MSICLILLVSGEEVVNRSLPIVGIWVLSNDGNYTRFTQFLSNKPGYEFKSNGQLVRYGNVGWCGTPPITYGNFDGQWNFINDTTLTIRSRYWGGYYTENVRYQFLTDDKNKVKFEWYDYRS